jgi:hypothetical protein
LLSTLCWHRPVVVFTGQLLKRLALGLRDEK